MVDIAELSEESQIELGRQAASINEFFDLIAQLTSTVGDLSREIVSLKARLATAEAKLGIY